MKEDAQSAAVVGGRRHERRQHELELGRVIAKVEERSKPGMGGGPSQDSGRVEVEKMCLDGRISEERSALILLRFLM